VPTDRCSESRDDRRSPLHRDLIASPGAKLKAEVPAPISSPPRSRLKMRTLPLPRIGDRLFSASGSARALACWRRRHAFANFLNAKIVSARAPKPAREGACAPRRKSNGKRERLPYNPPSCQCPPSKRLTFIISRNF
jgi:hypothetical protein